MHLVIEDVKFHLEASGQPDKIYQDLIKKLMEHYPLAMAIDSSTLIKAAKWDALGEAIGNCYMVEDPNDSDKVLENEDPNVDLTTIGELAATAYNWI